MFKMISSDGQQSIAVDLDYIKYFLYRQSGDLKRNKEYIDYNHIAEKIFCGIYDNIEKDEFEDYSANVCASQTYKHYVYSDLAAVIVVNKLHAKTEDDYSKVVKILWNNGIVCDSFYSIAVKYSQLINAAISYEFDKQYTYFGLKTLIEGKYLLRVNNVIVERPQHMLMRVALQIHGDDIESAIESYRLMRSKMFTHASPTLFSAGMKMPQMSSCYLLNIQEDSINGIYRTLNDCAMISKHGGGIGLNVTQIRAANSTIKSTNGTAAGLGPALRVFNSMLRHVDQGGKRKGAMAVYIEPWHADIFTFLDLKRNMGAEDMKARDLLFAIWTPSLFMERVRTGGKWSLMCPDECPGLNDCYGEKFKRLYESFEAQGKFREQIMALDLHRKIIETQVETGTPYMIYKDHVNEKNNQKNLGVIRNSNLCAEIVQYSDNTETAVCNLASIAVNNFANKQSKSFDFESLYKVSRVVTNNLNRIIDANFYPLVSAQISNFKHRPIGIGIQGLADAFAILDMPYDSQEARELNRKISETIYYGALVQSIELAKLHGTYDSYAESPASRGLLQFDLWNITQSNNLWDWKELKQQLAVHGLRNSLLIAYMPTATTAQILGNNESFEPFTSNLYVRRVLSGEYQVVNQHLVDKLIESNVYSTDLMMKIIKNNGSVQNIDEIPPNVKELFKTAWEIKQKVLLNMAADRGPYIDQSQSLNLFVADPSYKILSSIHNYSWEKGLKTGMYYLRTKPAANTIQFTVPSSSSSAAAAAAKPNSDADNEPDTAACYIGCESCQG
ncbi:RR1 [Chrysodeixis includens nucleopolyhedrovirus]|uniref:Ribonucleoside-diphosphate reductase n=1 Tax=Chrysodeixis includens nucleopolyhedrovirus TaxID=1207438 RepID=A0A1C8ZY07_9ABAC|nr:RR1 [Chrysodeixis includens nucleopolyhedrovirus]AOL56861.1 RR1 [Chrysodeixis includens nucleopolyhedrovirus]